MVWLTTSLSPVVSAIFSLTGAFQLEIRIVCQLFESEQKWSYSLPECVNLCSCSRVSFWVFFLLNITVTFIINEMQDRDFKMAPIR